MDTPDNRDVDKRSRYYCIKDSGFAEDKKDYAEQ